MGEVPAHCLGQREEGDMNFIEFAQAHGLAWQLLPDLAGRDRALLLTPLLP